jgi:hypothetical protein
VTAAAAVIALAISLMAVRDIPNRRAVPPAGPAPAADVPPYNVALQQTGKSLSSPEGLVVGDTFTGARLATIPPPRGSTFAGVTGAADDRTFVVDTTLATGNGSPPWPA